MLGARIVVIPVSVTGNMRNPVVKPLPVGVVGHSLVNLMGAVLKAPVELLDPQAGKAKP